MKLCVIITCLECTNEEVIYCHGHYSSQPAAENKVLAEIEC